MNIKYLFFGDELGGRINDSTCYKDEMIPEQKVGYALHLNYDKIINKEWFNSGINKIIELIQKGNCAIMCSEENPEKCHRELIIGRRLREIGINIIHIRSNKNKQDQLNLF